MVNTEDSARSGIRTGSGTVLGRISGRIFCKFSLKIEVVCKRNVTAVSVLGLE